MCMYAVNLPAPALFLMAHPHAQEPTLGSILSSQTTAFVDGRDTVTTAAGAIAKGKKAVRRIPFQARLGATQTGEKTR